MWFLCGKQRGQEVLWELCKKLKFGNRWAVSDPIGKKRGMLVAWNELVNIKRIRINDLCMEMQVESEDGKENF